MKPYLPNAQLVKEEIRDDITVEERLVLVRWILLGLFQGAPILRFVVVKQHPRSFACLKRCTPSVRYD